MANKSFTTKLRPASGPDAAPGKGSRKVWGTRAPTGSAEGTEIILPSLVRMREEAAMDSEREGPITRATEPQCRQRRTRCARRRQRTEACPARYGRWGSHRC